MKYQLGVGSLSFSEKKRLHYCHVQRILTFVANPLGVCLLFGFCIVGVAMSNFYLLSSQTSLSTQYNQIDRRLENNIPMNTDAQTKKEVMSVVPTTVTIRSTLPLDNNDERLDWPFRVYRHARIYVIHVGKTGGATLNEVLKFKVQQKKFLECRMHRPVVLDPCRNRRLRQVRKQQQQQLQEINGRLREDRPSCWNR